MKSTFYSSVRTPENRQNSCRRILTRESVPNACEHGYSAVDGFVLPKRFRRYPLGELERVERLAKSFNIIASNSFKRGQILPDTASRVIKITSRQRRYVSVSVIVG